MESLESNTPRRASSAETHEYIYDMIAQLAQLARQTGDAHVATHLEVIVAIRRATAEARAAR